MAHMGSYAAILIAATETEGIDLTHTMGTELLDGDVGIHRCGEVDEEESQTGPLLLNEMPMYGRLVGQDQFERLTLIQTLRIHAPPAQELTFYRLS